VGLAVPADLEEDLLVHPVSALVLESLPVAAESSHWSEALEQDLEAVFAVDHLRLVPNYQ
jgi:hypothetical protein